MHLGSAWLLLLELTIAVLITRFLVNDPTTGYGIFIENMLDAAA